MALKIRAGQREFERGIEEHRIAGFLTRRQYGKTTEAARIALKKMMRQPGHTIVFGSVKLDLGREIVRKEAEQIQRAFLGRQKNKEDLLRVVDAGAAGKTDKPLILKPDDFAELYEAQRLEFRLYHSRSVYSRTKVVALTPEAVGETGDLILDEVGRVRKFRDVWEAVKPIIASNPQFRCILTTTPPPDDTHYSFELLAPPIDWEPEINPAGNWYRSDLGVHVLRVTAWDAYADGIPLYDDDTGKAQSPGESREADHDKDAWDRNYGVKFVIGGTAACGLLLLDTAQRRGVGECIFARVEDDGNNFEDALGRLAKLLGTGRVGVGWDLATTTKTASNPSAVAVVEQGASGLVARGIFVWKTADPAVALERVRMILDAVKAREEGGRARRLGIDATNERYFAADARKEFQAEVPVELVVGSERVEKAGREPMSTKQFLGCLLVGELEDNHLTLPADRYVREDFRLVKRDRGTFVCEPDAQGRHGDTFDATKIAIHMISGTHGLETMDGVSIGHTQPNRAWVPRGRSRTGRVA